MYTYIPIYLCTYINTYTHTYIYTYCMHAYRHIYMLTYIHTHTHTHTHIIYYGTLSAEVLLVDDLYTKNLHFSIINIKRFCEDKELEACDLRLDFLSFRICIITVYRSPNGNFQYFIKGLDNIINKIYKPGVQLIICGDINITYLSESKEKHELNNILSTYNLISVINFPTRIKNNSSSLIDNIFLDTTKLGKFSTSPVVNGLSDHDAQMLELQVGNLKKSKHKKQTFNYKKN